MNARSEQRRQERVRRRLKVRFFEPKFQKHCIGFTRDASVKGLFVEANRVPDLDQSLSMLVELPESVAEVQGVVVWQKKVGRELRSIERAGFGFKVLSAVPEWYQFFLREQEGKT